MLLFILPNASDDFHNQNASNHDRYDRIAVHSVVAMRQKRLCTAAPRTV